MANVLVNDLYLGDIADAIREKLNVQTTYKPSEMAAAIETISGGGGITPTGSITITTNTTTDVTNYASAITNVPTGAAKSSSDLTANNLTVTAPAGLYSSDASKTLTDANLTSGNIKKDVTIFGVTGSYEGGGGGGGTGTLESPYYSIHYATVTIGQNNVSNTRALYDLVMSLAGLPSTGTILNPCFWAAEEFTPVYNDIMGTGHTGSSTNLKVYRYRNGWGEVSVDQSYDAASPPSDRKYIVSWIQKEASGA